MRETLHKRGELYQSSVKRWLASRMFLGFKVKPFGDTYDATGTATCIGNTYFDLSFALNQGNSARQILYIECKYRNEKTGDTNSEFREFIEKVFYALTKADTDQAARAEFCFICTVPPGDWRKFLQDRDAYCINVIQKRFKEKNSLLPDAMCERIHILVLSERILGGV